MGFSDHYFEIVRKEKFNIDVNENNFKVSYMDNIFYNDIYYGKTISVKIIKMFIRLLTKHSNLTLYLKPKSKLSLENLKNLMPIINEYIDNNRIKIFLYRI